MRPLPRKDFSTHEAFLVPRSLVLIRSRLLPPSRSEEACYYLLWRKDEGDGKDEVRGAACGREVAGIAGRFRGCGRLPGCVLLRRGVGDAGEFKVRDRDIIEKYPNGKERVRFRTVPAGKSPAAVEELVGLWRSCVDERWVHPLIELAAFNLDFLCIHPSGMGTGAYRGCCSCSSAINSASR